MKGGCSATHQHGRGGKRHMKSHFGGRPPPPPPLFPLPPSFWQRRLEEESSPLRLPPFPLPSFLPNLISHVDVGEKEEKEEEGKAAISGGERKRKEKILPLSPFFALFAIRRNGTFPLLFFSPFSALVMGQQSCVVIVAKERRRRVGGRKE